VKYFKRIYVNIIELFPDMRVGFCVNMFKRIELEWADFSCKTSEYINNYLHTNL